MGYRLKNDESVIGGVRRVATEEIDDALDEIADDGLDIHETVHQVRKRCKKLRGLLRLVRPAFEETYQRENVWHRDTARLLSDARDATAHLETLDALGERFRDELDADLEARTREVLEKRRAQLVEDQEVADRLRTAADRLVEGRRRVGDWDLDGEGYAETIGPGLRKTYKRACDRMREAWTERSTHVFHEWRKRVKYHRYHVRLLVPTWPDGLDGRRSACHQLSDLLGDEHDLAELRQAISNVEGREVLQALVDRRRAELREAARPVSAKLFAESPDELVDRFETYVRAARLDGGG